MKTRAMAWLAMSAVACGGGETQYHDVASERAALTLRGCPTVPTFPARATELSSARLAAPLFNAATARSAYTFYYDDPSDPTRFYAIAWDIAADTNLFFVTGAKALTAATAARIAQDYVQANKGVGDDAYISSIGKKGGGGPCPGPGTTDPVLLSYYEAKDLHQSLP